MRTRSAHGLPGALLLSLAACAAHGTPPGPAPLPAAYADAARSVAAASLRQRVPWTLAWSDEFDASAPGAVPDPAKWSYDVGAGGWGNGERQTYCAPGAPPPCDPTRPNAYQDGRGALVIEARRGAAGAWTSARLKTQGLARFQYGRVEARMRLPAGAGLWPAFWLLGADIADAGWPASGEIDVMENVPALGRGRVRATIHGPGYSGTSGVGAPFAFPDGETVDGQFHVYGLIWSPGLLEFYVDDWARPFAALTPASLPPGARWAFDKPYFLLLNLAVGGGWPGAPDARTPSPAAMLVDYVRVYRRRAAGDPR